MTKLAPLGLLALVVSLTGCFGTGKDCDTSTGADCDTNETDADTDADSDSDSDSDSDADTDVYFDAEAFSVSTRFGYDGEGLVPWNTTNGPQDPYAIVYFAEAEYFDTGDDRYSCYDYYTIVENGVDDLGVDDIWVGWDVSLVYLGAGDSPCENFEEALWGDDNPIAVIEGTAMGMVSGPMSDQYRSETGALIEGWGYDWDAEWAPFVTSNYFALYDDESGGLAAFETGVNFAIELDGDMNVVTGSNCFVSDAQCAEVIDASEYPSPTLGLSVSWSWPYTSNLF